MLACGLATAARINQGSSMSGASEAASCAQLRAACLSPRWRALMACFKAWLGGRGWLAILLSIPIILLAFYFDWHATHNGIFMVFATGIINLENKLCAGPINLAATAIAFGLINPKKRSVSLRGAFFAPKQSPG